MSAVFQESLLSQDPLTAAEQDSLDRAGEQINGLHWLNERVETGRMQALLAGCDGALVAYDPILHRQRSSGLLWCYGAARWRSGRPAVVVGRAVGWQVREARDLGLGWRSGNDGGWLECLAALVDQSCAGSGSAAQGFRAYGQRMLGEGFAGHVARPLLETQAPESQIIEWWEANNTAAFEALHRCRPGRRMARVVGDRINQTIIMVGFMEAAS